MKRVSAPRNARRSSSLGYGLGPISGKNHRWEEKRWFKIVKSAVHWANKSHIMAVSGGRRGKLSAFGGEGGKGGTWRLQVISG